MDTLIEIQLTPYQALTLLSFLSEFKDNMNEKRLTHLKMCIEAYTKEVYQKVTTEMLKEVKAELTVNQFFGFEPDN